MTRQEAIEWLKFMREQEPAKGELNSIQCKTEIALQVAIDVLKQPKIVRCKNCLHGMNFAPVCKGIHCARYDKWHNEDWFCADGEWMRDWMRDND